MKPVKVKVGRKFLTVRLAKSRHDFEHVRRIRNTVFIREQHVPKKDENDGLDAEAAIVIAHYGRRAVGTGRVRMLHGSAKLERLAVLRRYRGMGFGGIISDYIINYGKMRGAKEVYMNAQYHLVDYYKRIGFLTRGKPFYEAGIKHIRMSMRLKRGRAKRVFF